MPVPAVSTYSMHVRNRLLETGRYLALIWYWRLRLNPHPKEFKALPVDLGIPSRQVAVVKLKNRTLSPVVEVFVEHAKKLAISLTRASMRKAG